MPRSAKKAGSCRRYGSGWMTALTRFGLSKAVMSPGLAPATGSRRALSGFDNFAESVATSPIIL
jgi:hypothetical protein